MDTTDNNLTLRDLGLCPGYPSDHRKVSTGTGTMNGTHRGSADSAPHVDITEYQPYRPSSLTSLHELPASEPRKLGFMVSSHAMPEDSLLPRKGNEKFLKAQRQYRRLGSGPHTLLRAWLPELVALTLSLASLTSLIAVLFAYEGRSITRLGLPPYLTLNGIVAAIATVGRACLMALLCAAIMQAMWLTYFREAGKTNCRSRLEDIDLFYEASNGAWGSFWFLFRMRRRHGFLALAGCLIMVFSLAYNAMAQQAIRYELLPSKDGALAENVPRSETWDQRIGHGTSKPFPPLEMVAAIYDGILTEELKPIEPSCPSGNCTWPDTTSLAICGACEKSTYRMLQCDPPQCSECGLNYTSACDYMLPSGAYPRIMNIAADSSQWTSGGEVARFAAIPGSGHAFNYSSTDRVYLLDVELFGTSFGTIHGTDSNLTLINTECALWMCVQNYHTEMESAVHRERVVSEEDELDSNYSVDTYLQSDDQFYHFPPMSIQPGGLKSMDFTVNLGAAESLSRFLTNSFTGNVSTRYGAIEYSSNFMLGIWQGTRDPDAWIANLAQSMTNVVRSFNQTSRPQYNGTSYELSIDILWRWMLFPIILVLCSAAYLIAVMLRTASHPDAETWKGSPLAFLLFGLQSDVKAEGLQKMSEDGWVAAQKELGECREHWSRRRVVEGGFTLFSKFLYCLELRLIN